MRDFVLIVCVCVVIVSGYNGGNKKYERILDENYDDPTFKNQKSEMKGFKIKGEPRENKSLIAFCCIAFFVVMSILTCKKKNDRKREMLESIRQKEIEENVYSESESSEDVDERRDIFIPNTTSEMAISNADMIQSDRRLISLENLNLGEDVSVNMMISQLDSGDITPLLMNYFTEKLPDMSLTQVTEMLKVIQEERKFHSERIHNQDMLQLKKLEVMSNTELMKKKINNDLEVIEISKEKIKETKKKNRKKLGQNEVLIKETKKRNDLKYAEENRKNYQFLSQQMNHLFATRMKYMLAFTIIFWLVLANKDTSALHRVIFKISDSWRWFITPTEQPLTRNSWFGNYVTIAFYVNSIVGWSKSIVFVLLVLALFIFVFSKEWRTTMILFIVISPFYDSIMRLAFYLAPFLLLQKMAIDQFYQEYKTNSYFPILLWGLVLMGSSFAAYSAVTTDPFLHNSEPGIYDTVYDVLNWIF